MDKLLTLLGSVGDKVGGGVLQLYNVIMVAHSGWDASMMPPHTSHKTNFPQITTLRKTNENQH